MAAHFLVAGVSSQVQLCPTHVSPGGQLTGVGCAAGLDRRLGVHSVDAALWGRTVTSAQCPVPQGKRTVMLPHAFQTLFFPKLGVHRMAPCSQITELMVKDSGRESREDVHTL